MSPRGPPAMPLPCFPNVGAGHLAVQNGYMGMPQSFNQIAPLPLHGQSCNAPQSMNPFLLNAGLQNLKQNMNLQHGQFCPHNMPLQPNAQFCHTMSHSLNPVTGLPNGQFCAQNVIQNSTNAALQCSKHQVIPNNAAPFNIHLSAQGLVACPNQIPHVLGSQNPISTVPPQLGSGSNMTPNNVHLSNEAKQFNDQGSVQMHLSQKNMQSHGFQQSQGNNVVNGRNGMSNFNQGSPRSKNFKGYGKGNNMRFQKSHLHHMANAKEKFRPAFEKRGKEDQNNGAEKSGLANLSKKVMGECQRSLPVKYSEEEIRQWRETRKKNFPSKTNTEKKLAERNENQEVIDQDAKMRRQQLKEILAKQAELGVEVAELPASYLSELENQISKREVERRPWNKQNKFQNKYNKRNNRHGKENRWAKKQRSGGGESSPASISNKRKPSLLQKLLINDVKRDKSRLLQVFRFMLSNSFFKDWPKKPLEFPLIIVKDEGIEDGFVKENCPLHKGDAMLSGVDNIVVEKIRHQNYNHSAIDENKDGDDNDNDNDDYGKGEDKTSEYIGENGIIREKIEKSEGEEGEIID